MQRIKNQMEELGVPYVEPDWKGSPLGPYNFQVIKQGVLLEPISIVFSKTFAVMGRVPVCDIPCDHASVSRFHLVLQCSKEGLLYAYDLKSSHGTMINKKVLRPHEYQLLKPGDFLQLGASTRTYVLEGNEELYRAALDKRQPPASSSKDHETFTEFRNPKKLLADVLAGYEIPLSFKVYEADGLFEANLGLSAKSRELLVDECTGKPLNLECIKASGSSRKDAETGVCNRVLTLLAERGMFIDDEREERNEKRMRQFYKDEALAEERDLFLSKPSNGNANSQAKEVSFEELEMKRYELMDITGKEISLDDVKFLSRLADENPQQAERIREFIQLVEEFNAANNEEVSCQKDLLNEEAAVDKEKVETESFRVKIPRGPPR